MVFSIALSGDSIINRRVSTVADPDFRGAMELYQNADVALTHLETLIHDFHGPEIYPAAEGGWSWMRSPAYLPGELRWAGIDGVSLACNHTLDYSYGGLFSTWRALESAGIAHAGTGMTLGESRSAAYIHGPVATVALLSVTSSFPMWSRAGDPRPDMPGRPGQNGMRVAYGLGPSELEGAKQTFRAWGWWVYEVEPGEWWTNPPGLHNTIYRFFEATDDGPSSRVIAEDLAANLAFVSDAAARADLVVVQIQCHEWEPSIGLDEPPAFLRQFARACIDAGAGVILAEGSHAPLRGIELYRGRPVIYDPGDLFRMSDEIAKYPHDFFERHRHAIDGDLALATQSQAIAGRAAPVYSVPWNPPGGYKTAPMLASFAPICVFDDDLRFQRLEVHPLAWSEKREGFRGPAGIPLLPPEGEARQVLEYVASLSARYGTRLRIGGGIGIVDGPADA